MSKLNDKQAAFVHEYLVDFNATQAAIRAGYSKKTAGSQAHDLLKKPEIQALLAEKREEVAAKVGLTVERTLKEVASVAYIDPRRLFDRKGALLQPKDWPDEVAAAVASIEVTREGSIKIRLWDKNSALEKAMKHQGLFELDNSQKTDPIAEAIAAVQAGNIPLAVKP